MYEAPYLEKSHKLSLSMLPNIFPLNSNFDGYTVCKDALKWWEENS